MFQSLSVSIRLQMVNQHEVYWSSTENSNSARSIDGRCSVYLCPVDHDDDRFADLCFKAEEDQYVDVLYLLFLLWNHFLYD